MKYIVEDVDLLAVISVVKIIVTVALMLLLPALLRRFGKTAVLAAGMAAQALGAIPLLFWGAEATHWQVIAMSTVTTLGLTYANSCCFAMVPDCVDYTQLHFGTAQVGFINATGTFVRKFCGSFATLIVGGLLAFVGYHADAVVTEEVRSMILWIKTWLPVLLLAFTVLLLRFYPITTAYGAEMRRKLADD